MPRVLAISEDQTMYIGRLCGTMDAYSLLTGAKREEKITLLREIIDDLAKLHLSCMDGIDYLRCYPSPVFGYSDVLNDMHYFEDYFLIQCGVDHDRKKLRKEFEKIALAVTRCHFLTFMYRDFQSRNIMVQETNCILLISKGGRRGPGVYDIISLVYQAKLGLDESDRKELCAYYVDQIALGFWLDCNSIK